MPSRVEGRERLKARLQAIPGRMRAEVRAAIEKSADELVGMQQRLAPVDDGVLRDSIRKEPGDHDLAVAVKAGSDAAFYARFVEFGTQRTPAQPFFFPAYRALRKRIRARISRAVRKAVRLK